jgi:hypothetical protein
MVDKLIRLILQLLPSDINEQSLDELDKRGWIIWDEGNDQNRPLD